MCQSSQGLVSHYILHLIIHPIGDIPSMQKLAGVLWSKVGVTLRKEGGGGNPSSRRPANQVPPFHIWVSRVHHPTILECTCLGLAVSGPALLLTLSSCSPGPGHYKPKGPVMSFAGTCFSSSLSPVIVQTWEPRQLRLQKCETTWALEA